MMELCRIGKVYKKVSLFGRLSDGSVKKGKEPLTPVRSPAQHTSRAESGVYNYSVYKSARISKDFSKDLVEFRKV